MSIQLDNTSLGSLVIKGPASGQANLIIPDMTALANKLLALNSGGSFAFIDIPTAYVLPIATDLVLGGVKKGNGIEIAADGTISISAGVGTVTSVNTKTGEVVITAEDLGLSDVATSGSYNDLADKPTIPTVPSVVSAFTNDAGYQTQAQVEAAVTALVNGAPEALDTLKEIADKLAADDSVTASILSSIGDKANTTWVTSELELKADVADLAVVATSGSYNDLADKPTIPTVPTVVSAFTNDAGYLTSVPNASASTLGVVKVGPGLVIAGDGALSVTGELISGSSGVIPVLASVATTDETPANLASFILADNSSLIFFADIVAKNSDGTAAAGYTLQGVVKRGTGANTVSFTGGVLKSIVAEDQTAWDANAAVNTTAGSLAITVTGTAATNLSWFTNVRVTYVK